MPDSVVGWLAGVAPGREALSTMRKRLLLSSLLLMVVATPLLFAYGPLFPWSPVTPGYQKIALQRAEILAPSGQTLPTVYRQIDQMIEECERFHRLKMHQPLRVVICADWTDFGNFLPTLRGARGVGAATLQTGTVIYITPRLVERKLDPDEFLRHELSHAIVWQNVTIWRSVRMEPHTWLSEGVPVWFGRQRSYVSQQQFREMAPSFDLVAILQTRDQKVSDIRFAYIAWRNFLDYLVQQRGADTFHAFFAKYREAPDEVYRSFEQIYGTSHEQAARAFEQAVRSGEFRASEE